MDLEFEAARVAETAQWGRWENEDAAFLDGGEFLTDDGEQTIAFEVGFGAIGEVVKDEESGTDVGLIGLEDGGVAGDGEGVGDAGDFAGHGVHPADNGIGALEGGGIGELDENEGVTEVLRRDEAAGDFVEDFASEADEGGVGDEHEDGDANEQADECGVGVGAEFEEAVEGAEEPAEEEVDELREFVRLGAMGLQKDRTEGGAEGDGIEGRDDGGDGDGEGELFVKLAGDAADEGGGNEDGAED